jgi:hypothetical protein
MIINVSLINAQDDRCVCKSIFASMFISIIIESSCNGIISNTVIVSYIEECFSPDTAVYKLLFEPVGDVGVLLKEREFIGEHIPTVGATIAVNLKVYNDKLSFRSNVL